MQRRILVRPAHGFMKRRQYLIVVVAVVVVAVCAALRRGLSVLHGDYAASVGVHAGGKPADLKCVYGLSGIARTVLCNVMKHAVLREHGGIFVVLNFFYGVLKCFFNFFRFYGFKLKNGTAA